MIGTPAIPKPDMAESVRDLSSVKNEGLYEREDKNEIKDIT